MNDICAKQELPIFREIVEALDGVIDALGENSNVVYNKVNSIREKTEPENEKLKPNSPLTVVEELWQKISELRDINYKFSLVRDNLQGLVG